jgi:CRP-like cAMP-binding protein
MHNQFNLALKDNYLFKNTNISKLTLEDLDFKLIALDEGEILFKNGDPSESIYLVIEGEVNLLRKRSFSKTTTRVFLPNDFFGQEEFFEGSNRKETALALKDTKLAELTREDLDKLVIQYNNVYTNLKESLTDVDDEVVQKLENLLQEARDKDSGKQKKASIFNLGDQSDENLKSFNESKKNEKIVAELNEKISRYHDLIKQKEEKITSLYNRLDDYQNTHKQLTNLMDNQNEQLARLLEVENNYKSQVAQYSNQIKELEEKINNSGQQLPELNEIIAVKDEELRQLREELQNKSYNQNEYENLANQFESEINNYKQEIKQLKNLQNENTNSDSDELQKLNTEIYELRNIDKKYKDLLEKFEQFRKRSFEPKAAN